VVTCRNPQPQRPLVLALLLQGKNLYVPCSNMNEGMKYRLIISSSGPEFLPEEDIIKVELSKDSVNTPLLTRAQ